MPGQAPLSSFRRKHDRLTAGAIRERPGLASGKWRSPLWPGRISMPHTLCQGGPGRGGAACADERPQPARERDPAPETRDPQTGHRLFRQGRSMRFELSDAAKEAFPVTRLCRVVAGSQSGCFAWRSRRARPRHRKNLGTGEGWLSPAVVLDLFVRRGVGWAVSGRLHQEPALEALRTARAIRLVVMSTASTQPRAASFDARLRRSRSVERRVG